MSTSALARTPSQNNRGGLAQRTTKPAPTTSTVSNAVNLAGTPQKSGNASPLLNTSQSQQKPLPRPPPQQQSSPAPSTPGRWEHPRINDIVGRRNRTKFDSNDTRVVMKNAAVLALTFLGPTLLQTYLPNWASVTSFWPMMIVWAIRLNFIIIIGVKCMPLFRKEDACEDIPLTPAQRQLLGLPPMSRPMTPQEKDQTTTPPRFSRSATPRSASSIQVNPSGSPLSERSALLDSASRSPANGSPYSPQLRSGGERRRLSYTSNRSSPLSISEFDAAGSVTTPTKGTRASVGLNNKWLYEKGRSSPRLSGSVFA